MYGFSSITITVLLFALILVANETGYRLGRRDAGHDEGKKSQTNAIQGGMLGLLALLLGFTFTMALQRYDARSQAVIDEANAIGTAYLRVDLLPEASQPAARDLFRKYVQLRIQTGQVDLAQLDARRDANAAVGRLHKGLWSIALEASTLDPRPATTGLFIQALNELIDAHGKRDAALRRHVPEVVLLLLFGVFLIAGAVLGYAGGLAGGRPLVATVAMAALIALVIFVIIDLDRPRRGLIQVNQDSMADLGAIVSQRDAAAHGNATRADAAADAPKDAAAGRR